jgi:hypothetical protein
MGKKYGRRKPARKFPKRFASDNIQVRSSTKGRSFTGAIMRGNPAILPNGEVIRDVGAAAYKTHLKSMGTVGRLFVDDDGKLVSQRIHEVPKTRTIAPRPWEDVDWRGNLRMQGIERYNYQVLLETPKFNILLFFSGDKFFFVEVTLPTGSMKKSITYTGRTRAEQVYNNSSYTWIERIEGRV